MLLDGRQEGHSSSKKNVVASWHGYLPGARCRFAYGPADTTATLLIPHDKSKHSKMNTD